MRSIRSTLTVWIFLLAGLSVQAQYAPEYYADAADVLDGLDFEEELGSARKGDSESQYRIALAYDTGIGTAPNSSLATFWFEKAAANGHPSANNNMGVRYELGSSGVRQNFEQAREHYLRGRELGSSRAIMNLGMLYQLGLGVEQDYELARVYLTEAAHLFEAGACNQLGLMAENGHGMQVDFAAAKIWYECGAAGGDGAAMNNLGNLHFYGLGVPKDDRLARKYFLDSASTQFVDGLYNAGLLMLQGTGGLKQPAQGMQFLERAARQGSGRAAEIVSKMYLFGASVPQDLQQSVYWLIVAEKLEQSGLEEHRAELASVATSADWSNAQTLAQQFEPVAFSKH